MWLLELAARLGAAASGTLAAVEPRGPKAVGACRIPEGVLWWGRIPEGYGRRCRRGLLSGGAEYRRGSG